MKYCIKLQNIVLQIVARMEYNSQVFGIKSCSIHETMATPT